MTLPYNEARADIDGRGLEGDELLAHLRAGLGKAHTVRIRRFDGAVEGGGVVEHDLKLALVVELDRTGRPKLRIGAGPQQRDEKPEMVDNGHRLFYAAEWTVNQMSHALQVTVVSVVGLFRGHVPMKEVGGPIFMAQLASRTAEQGWGSFFFLMVWLSVNLAIINLLPIPIADGGQLLFLAIEAVRRKPVSVRTRMVAAYIGLTFLALIFVVVMKNDVQRVIATFGN